MLHHIKQTTPLPKVNTTGPALESLIHSKPTLDYRLIRVFFLHSLKKEIHLVGLEAIFLQVLGEGFVGDLGIRDGVREGAGGAGETVGLAGWAE
jgi:hypothetical protein